MKRSTTMIAALLLTATAALSGCGKSDSGSASSPAPSNGTASATPAASVKPAGEKVKLTMGSWRTEDTEAYKKIIAEFNKTNPNIEITFSPTKNTEYNTALNTALQAGSGPDIIHLRPYAPGRQLADGGFLEPLTSLKGIDTLSKDALLAATGTDGKVYGVPTVYSATEIFYNKKLFKKFSIEEPKTWDDLIKAADTLKKNKIAPFAFGSKEGWLLSLIHGAVGPQFYGGTDFVQKVTTGQTKLTSKEFTDSIQAMKDLIPYFPDNYVGLGMDDIRNLFVTEQAGMMIMGDWEIAVMRKANPDLDFDMFPVPPKAGGKATVTTWVDGSFSVNAKSAHKAEALKFLEYMTTKEFGKLVVDNLLKPSTIQGVTASDPLVAKISKYADTQSTPYMFVIHFAGGNPTTKVTLENSLQSMYLNKMTPQQVTEETQKSADTWFKPAAK